ncbi:hypothetical protein ACET3Z_010475 [Daucus carota]
MLREKMAESRDVDEHFKQNFMILMANIFIRIDKTSFVFPKILKFTGNFDNARDYNWCKLLLHNLKVAHEQWWNDPHTQYYTGCFVFLLYFYLARTSHLEVKVKKTWPTFIGWKNSCIDDRAKRESLDNNFGHGDIGGNSNYTTPKETLKGVGPSRLFSPQDNVDASILSIARDVEQNHNSTEVLTEDEISSRLEHHLSQMERLKKEFDETLDKGKQLFPEMPYCYNFITITCLDRFLEFLFTLCQNSIDKDWDFFTYNDWKTFDILLLPEHDRAFNKMHDIDDFLDELKLGGEVVFLWNNVVCLKHRIQSLQIGKEVLFHVVDAYTIILNEEERLKATESPYRFFCSTMVTMGNVVKGSHLVANNTDPNITYMKFKSNMDAILFKNRVDINHVDLIVSKYMCFFSTKDLLPNLLWKPLLRQCFNLKKVTVEIIDNRSGGRVNIMYDGIPETLQENFGLYLAQQSPRKTKLLNNAPVTRLELKWRTSNKNVDSGVFVMHHMETYMGYGLRNWDCKFAAEDTGHHPRESNDPFAASDVGKSPCLGLFTDALLMQITVHIQKLDLEMCLEVHFLNNLVREAENVVTYTPNSDTEAAFADANGSIR